jgi:hypothetical protein
MKFKSINKQTKDKQKELQELIRHIKNGKNSHVFILIHRTGCPPCEATRPEWLKLENKLSKKHKTDNNVLVADVEEQYMDGLQPNEMLRPEDAEDTVLKPYIGDVDGFPTMKLIKDNGNTKEPYESSNISKKDRSLDSFTEWIESNINKNQSQSQSLKTLEQSLSSPYKLLNRLSNKKYNKQKKTKRATKMKGGKRKIKSRQLKTRKTKTRRYKK